MGFVFLLLRIFIEGSVFDIKRLIFSLCDHQISTVKIIINKPISGELPKKRKNGVTNEQPREAKDDFFDIMASKSQVKQTIKPLIKFIAKIIPKKVATPFPPLNL